MTASSPIEPTINEGAFQANALTKLTAGPLSSAIAAIWPAKRITQYLLETDQRRHVWNSWISAHEQEIVHSKIAASIAREHLVRSKSCDLIAEIFGLCPPGLLRTLSKLGLAARDARVYSALVKIHAQGGPAAKYLRFCKSPSDAAILGFATLPGGACDEFAVRQYAKGRCGSEKLGAFSWMLARVEKLWGPDRVQEIMSASRPWEELWDVASKLGYPPPPWTQLRQISPVDSCERLVDVAHRFHNCLMNHQQMLRTRREILAGSLYLYEWLGDEGALLAFYHAGSLGWILKEAAGIGNAPLSQPTKDEIAGAFSGVEDACVLLDPGFSGLPITTVFWEESYD